MRTKLLTSVALATALMASPVLANNYAANPNPTPDQAKQLCSKLSDQFEFLTPFKKGVPYWSKASAEFKDGQQACENGKPVVGAKDMQTAISDMYVVPDSI
ncbi:MAG: hypothetical protein GC184_00490 [Rhizobiales bacterium]|nr:hypothetical protein [Hyphomicrobiales bacterium]